MLHSAIFALLFVLEYDIIAFVNIGFILCVFLKSFRGFRILKQPYLEFLSCFQFFVLFLFSGAVRMYSPGRIIINNF